jgi:dinuclear metal center YbgI/SA1388 family protein
MKIRQITNYLESVAPLSLQEDYDNSGLIIGNEETEVTNALMTLDCTEAVVDEAIQKKCNLIIAHHPIVFRGLKKFTGKNYVERVVLKAIQNNISVYAIHTNLDNVSEGVNKRICEKLGLNNPKFLAVKLPSPGREAQGVRSGSGMIGTLSKPMSEIAFLNKVKKVFCNAETQNVASLRYTDLTGKKVSRIAVCGGSGSFLLEAAIAAKADFFVTSDFKYHQFFDADNQLVIADIGHYESEQYTKELLRDLLKRKFPIFAPHLSKVKTNPVNYL